MIANATEPNRRAVTAERKQFSKDELRRSSKARFAKNLRDMMDARVWEVGDLHERLTAAGSSVVKGTIHKWLRGESCPDWDEMKRLGGIFHPDNWRLIYPE